MTAQFALRLSVAPVAPLTIGGNGGQAKQRPLLGCQESGGRSFGCGKCVPSLVVAFPPRSVEHGMITELG